MRIQHLKVKIKSLAAEAVIIRSEESKTKDPYARSLLREHRITVVRDEQRYSLLAYGYLRGKTLAEVERKGKKPIDPKRLRTLIQRFMRHAVKELDLQRWLRGVDV